MRRTIFIGDVHGCLAELESLLIKVNYQADDRLILLGDLINKGPSSFAVLKLAHKLKCEVVIGNHELRFLKYVRKQETGHAVFDELKRQVSDQLDFWISWIESWPSYIDCNEFIAVHAGFPPGPIAQVERSVLANIRMHEDRAWYEHYHGQKLVVFGHWAQRGLVVRENAIGLDSGCVYGKKLTALILPERALVQVSAKEIYMNLLNET